FSLPVMISNRKRCQSEDPEQPNETSSTKIVAREDFFSQLPDDCIRDIFTLINHNDLDEAATLSRRHCGLSRASRSKAQRIEATRLEVSQITPTMFHLIVDFYGGSKYFFETTCDDDLNPKIYRLRKGKRDKHNKNFRIVDYKITSAVATQWTVLLHRFKFRYCSLH
ncbi:hypothetical protein PENTCL1PPCAC_23933, partial [Pristionchus entomophagus]